jgi:ankyrin repeat protein
MCLLTPSQPLSPTMAKASSTTPESPVQYLRSLFPKDGRVHSPPSTVDPDNYEPYDMATVQAIRNKDVSKLRILLEEGKCFDACNRNGESLLHLACRRGDLKTVKFLLDEACVQADVCDDMGRNILHDVCWRPKPDLELTATLMRTLLPETLIAEDRRGHTPFDYVRREHWGVWMDFLQENQGFIEHRVALVSFSQIA